MEEHAMETYGILQVWLLQHEDQPDFLLGNHAPEVSQSRRHRQLRGHELALLEDPLDFGGGDVVAVLVRLDGSLQVQSMQAACKELLVHCTEYKLYS